MKRKNVILSLVIFLPIIIVLLVDIMFLNNKHPMMSGYASNFVTEYLGIAITVFIIQKIFDKYKEVDDKQQELEKIKRKQKIIKLVIENYFKYFYYVVTPKNKRTNANIIPNEFDFDDLIDMYEPTDSTLDPYFQPAIENFIVWEKQIREHFLDLINEINFTYYKSIEKLMLDFIQVSIKNDVSNTLIKMQTAIAATTNNDGGQTKESLSSFLTKFLPRIKILHEKYKNGDVNKDDPFMPFYILYDLLSAEKNILEQYNEEINNMVN